MKSKSLIKIVLLKAVMLFHIAVAYTQDSTTISYQEMIVAKKFIFKAQSVFPQRGGTRQLTSGYEMKLSGDSIATYLPYFGRAYTASPGSGGGGIEFTSTDFTYTVEKKTKGWDITIIPKDAGDVRQLFLSVSTNGYTSLYVTSNNREGISYSGMIQSP